MAIEKIGDAFLSSVVGVMIDKLENGSFDWFFASQNMDPGLLHRLKVSLNTAYSVVDDAESKEITDENVEKWVSDLRDAIFHAHDLLDSIDYAATAKKIQPADPPRSAIYSLNRFKRARVEHFISQKMDEIVRKLDHLLQQTASLGLKVGVKEDASSVNPLDIVGRDEDKEAIFQLLEQNGADGNGIDVIAIVGMGGIGKTTLAQLIYNDIRTKSLFKCRAWVCVSENYDELRITKEVLKQVEPCAKCDNWTAEKVDMELKKSLNGKKFLLFLDNIWNGSYINWVFLRERLESGALGTKIIITTRTEQVASTMRTFERYHRLNRLNDDCCWQIFVKHAFLGGRVDNQSLKAIGKEIVRKCKGLPLAAKMLGGLLRSKREVAEWEEVLNNNLWDLQNTNVLPALWLSYQDLPSYLKQCFAYCAMFPKDFHLKKEEIIPLWMAEGFLEQPVRGGRRDMEELGEKCFEELVSRSFLQQDNNPYDGSFFLMHDLINDLAKLVSKDFLIRADGKNSCDFNDRNRYFSLMMMSGSNTSSKTLILNSTTKAPFLRSIFPLHRYDRFVNDAVVNDVVSRLHCLRVLSLRGFKQVKNLPENIDNLKHLWYLNLEGTNVERLPDSVCTLYHLQTLILYECHQLSQLPKEIRRLTNLHFLDIRETIRLKETPPKMGNLKELRTLGKFIVGKQEGCDITELEKLQLLRGDLHIFNIKDAVDTSKDILRNKKHLQNLTLEWRKGSDFYLSGTRDVNFEHERNVLERLQPHENIENLTIDGYGGREFANWVGDASYAKIVSLDLHCCIYCTSLPPVEQLSSSLQHLTISNCDEVVRVSMKSPSLRLKTLRIYGMRKWEEWIFCEENHSGECGLLAKLELLSIEKCPKIKSISTCGRTSQIFQSLHILEVQRCPKLETSNLIAISNLKQLPMTTDIPQPSSDSDYYEIPFSSLDAPQARLKLISGAVIKSDLTENGIEGMGIPLGAIEEIDIKHSDSLECIPVERFPNLKHLHVGYCELNSLAASEEPLHLPLPPLASLKLWKCDKLVCFPRWGIPLPNLTRLKLWQCSNLVSLPEGMHVLLPSLIRLAIGDCDEIESFPDGGLPVHLQSLKITGKHSKLIRGRQQWALPTLHALSKLHIGRYDGDDLESFSDDTLLPSTLTFLEITQVPELIIINNNGFQHLTSLVQLNIGGCRKLQSLPEQGLPSSLSFLKINGCPELESLGGLSANLQSLHIWYSDKLIGGRLQWGWETRLNALSELSLCGYRGNDLDCFPEEALLPSTLTSLMISRFENLKEINYNGLKHLTSLAKLEISICLKLQCLPKEGLPRSLSTLTISCCPSLKERYENEENLGSLKVRLW